MELGGRRRSTNIEDRRGKGPGAGAAVGGLGLGGVIIVGLVLLFFPDARPLVSAILGEQAPVAQQDAQIGAPTDEMGDRVAAVLGSIEDVWTEQFAQGRMASYGLTGSYQPATLVLFSDAVQSGCGFAQAAVGPFYCPADSKMYLDLSFFQQLDTELGAGGDFAQAYVIAHEVGHHIQNLAGISEQAFAARQRLPEREANELSVRVELMADCLAGVWGHHSGRMGELSPGDIEEALRAAEAIGDDTLQKRGRGYVVPDSFTHGTSAQRMRWLTRGLESGDPARCDTLNGQAL